MDIRELANRADFEEVIRTAFAGMMSHVWTAMPVQVYEDSADGHTAKFQVTVKRAVQNLSTGEVTYEDHPVSVDVPVHHPAGGKVVSTYPTKKGDEGVGLFANRNIDGWHQNGATQPPVDNRSHSVGDMMHVRGHRSDPNKLQQVGPDSIQHRSVDKNHVSEVHPQDGVTHKSVDPSTGPATQDFDPFTQAVKFFSHQTHPTVGVLGKAVDGSTTHDHGVTHLLGAFMRALNGAHSVLAHPQDGASMNAANLLHQVLCHPSNGAAMLAQNGLHKVLAHPTMGAALIGGNGASSVVAGATLALKSATGMSFDCPVGGFSMPKGAASSNVGPLSGDLSGTLSRPQVVGLGNVDTTGMVVAASDSAAAQQGVALHHLYLNTSVSSGAAVLCSRMS